MWLPCCWSDWQRKDLEKGVTGGIDEGDLIAGNLTFVMEGMWGAERYQKANYRFRMGINPAAERTGL